MSTKFIALGTFLVSLGIALYYTFMTKCFTVYDATRDYWLFNYYRDNPTWHPMEGVNGLQNTALFSGYFPAMLQRVTQLPPDILFKVYIAVGVALVPVITFLIAQKLIDKWYAVFSAIYLMGWVAFYQGGSYARLNFAVTLFGLMVLVYLSKWRVSTKLVVGSLLAILLPFAHYGGAGVTALVLIGVTAVLVIRKRWLRASGIGVVTFMLIGSFFVWQVKINSVAWEGITTMLQDAVIMGQKGVGADSIKRYDKVVIAIVPTNTTSSNVSVNGTSSGVLSVMSRDKITQAIFGVVNPDNANVYSLNKWLLLFAWVTIMLMLVGVYYMLRGTLSLELKALTVFLLIAIGVTVLLPQVSRGYGIEKVYYQAIVITGIGIVIGGNRIATRLHIPTWLLLSLVVLPYVGLMWRFGVIISILG